MAEHLPADVQEFIGQNIQSIAQLEVLLLLRSDRSRAWTGDQVAKSLYISPQMAGGLLEEISRRGFIVSTGEGVRFNPSESVDRLIERLAQLYHERRVAVTTAIYSQPLSAAQSFADAFRLRKEK